MPLPETTIDDIEDGVEVDIVAYITSTTEFDDGDRKAAMRDIEGEELELKLWPGDADDTALRSNSWVHIQDAEGDLFGGDVLVDSNRGAISIDYLEEQPPIATFDPEGESAPAEGGIVALDIETISTVPESDFDFENSEHVELLCVGVGYAPEPGAPGEADVLFRRDSSTESERTLLTEVAAYVEQRDPAQVVTFKGDFDRRHLPGRAAIIDGEASPLHDRVESIFSDNHWNDLSPYGSIEDAADVRETHWDVFEHDLDPVTWREDHPRHDAPLNERKINNHDVPYFGEAYLEEVERDPDSVTARGLKELLYLYTVRDIYPLFELLE